MSRLPNVKYGVNFSFQNAFSKHILCSRYSGTKDSEIISALQEFTVDKQKGRSTSKLKNSVVNEMPT